ncbi:hypothetical protein ETB97_011005 [Aspergillus alliaceus]|uniref:Uncharacterized protein n=1 Tax=Petromyces alliaceus TaxID=209559 RepID=A0A8H5ZT52_PETAA|nr:hypothetical protein ETB97_011005 [Aspergillus burnettii]
MSQQNSAAERAIKNDENFYSLPLDLGAYEWTCWLKVLREKAFDEHIICFVKEGHPCGEMPECSWKVDIRHPDQRVKLQKVVVALENEVEEVLADDFHLLGFLPETGEDRVYIQDWICISDEFALHPFLVG